MGELMMLPLHTTMKHCQQPYIQRLVQLKRPTRLRPRCVPRAALEHGGASALVPALRGQHGGNLPHLHLQGGAPHRVPKCASESV